MSSARRWTPALAVVGIVCFGACGVGLGDEWPSVLDCGQEDSDPTFCCPPVTYTAIDPTAFGFSPGSLVGRRVGVLGVATVHLRSTGADDCFGIATLECIHDLVLDAVGCDGMTTQVPVGGEYGGEAATCTDFGCRPLTPGLSYAVCGEWAHNPTTTFEPGADLGRLYWLTIDSYCEAL